MRSAAIAVILFASPLGLGPTRAEKVHTATWYDDNVDEFRTRGYVDLDLPLPTVTAVAAAFDDYRLWALRHINHKKGGGTFITQLRDVRFLPRAGKQGAFVVYYDLDLIWPFGSDGQRLQLDVQEARPHPSGGVDRLVVRLGHGSSLLNNFHLTLVATGDGTKSRISFYSRVEIVGIIDAFFTLGVYRRNIEYRIVKVVQNLGFWLKKRRSAPPPG